VGATKKRYERVQVNRHRNLGQTIAEWQKRGWRLSTYAPANLRGSKVNHYLLFERGRDA
jgi:hypothetical protein